MGKIKKITAFFENLGTDIEVLDYLTAEEIKDNEMDFSEIRDELQEKGAFEAEVIYYAVAMDYLSEYDNSLTEALEIASEMGYTTNNLNSEILASILKSRHLEEDFLDHETEIDNFLTDLF